MTEPQHIDVHDDLDLDQDEPIEITREQELSRLPLRALQKIAKEDYGLSAAGKSHELISRIVKFEETGIIPENEMGELKPGVAPSPVEPTALPPVVGASEAPAPAGVSAASAGAGPRKKAPPQKTGFFPDLNVYRVEFPIGPRGSIDDATHMQFIEDAHTTARQAGYRTLGAPHAGVRVGRSTMNVNGAPMATAVYEVCAREE